MKTPSEPQRKSELAFEKQPNQALRPCPRPENGLHPAPRQYPRLGERASARLAEVEDQVSEGMANSINGAIDQIGDLIRNGIVNTIAGIADDIGDLVRTVTLILTVVAVSFVTGMVIVIRGREGLGLCLGDRDRHNCRDARRAINRLSRGAHRRNRHWNYRSVRGHIRGHYPVCCGTELDSRRLSPLQCASDASQAT